MPDLLDQVAAHLGRLDRKGEDAATQALQSAEDPLDLVAAYRAGVGPYAKGNGQSVNGTPRTLDAVDAVRWNLAHPGEPPPGTPPPMMREPLQLPPDNPTDQVGPPAFGPQPPAIAPAHPAFGSGYDPVASAPTGYDPATGGPPVPVMVEQLDAYRAKLDEVIAKQEQVADQMRWLQQQRIAETERPSIDRLEDQQYQFRDPQGPLESTDVQQAEFRNADTVSDQARWLEAKKISAADENQPFPPPMADPNPPEDASATAYLLNPSKETLLIPWREWKGVKGMIAVKELVEEEVAFRVAQGIYTPADKVFQRPWEEWAKEQPNEAKAVWHGRGTWAKYARTEYLDTETLRANVHKELLNGLPMYSPGGADAQDKIYTLLAQGTPEQLPTARGFFKKVAQFSGNIAPMLAELAVFRRALRPLGRAAVGPGAPKTFGTKVPKGHKGIKPESVESYSARTRGAREHYVYDAKTKKVRLEYQGNPSVLAKRVENKVNEAVRKGFILEAEAGRRAAYVTEGLAFGTHAAIHGEDPTDSVLMGMIMGPLGEMGAAAGAKATAETVGPLVGRMAATGALFGTDTAMHGGDWQDVLIAGVVAPIAFHAKDIVNHTFRPRAMVQRTRGDRDNLPQDWEGLRDRPGMVAKAIVRWHELAKGSEPGEPEFRGAMKLIDKLWERRGDLKVGDRLLLEGFIEHYNPKLVRRRSGATTERTVRDAQENEGVSRPEQGQRQRRGVQGVRGPRQGDLQPERPDAHHRRPAGQRREETAPQGGVETTPPARTPEDATGAAGSPPTSPAVPPLEPTPPRTESTELGAMRAELLQIVHAQNQRGAAFTKTQTREMNARREELRGKIKEAYARGETPVVPKTPGEMATGQTFTRPQAGAMAAQGAQPAEPVVKESSTTEPEPVPLKRGDTVRYQGRLWIVMSKNGVREDGLVMLSSLDSPDSVTTDKVAQIERLADQPTHEGTMGGQVVEHWDKGGVSTKVKSKGLHPAFLNPKTSEVYYDPERGMHVFEIVPQKYWLATDRGDPTAIEGYLEAGFVDAEGRWFSRSQAGEAFGGKETIRTDGDDSVRGDRGTKPASPTGKPLSFVRVSSGGIEGRSDRPSLPGMEPGGRGDEGAPDELAPLDMTEGEIDAMIDEELGGARRGEAGVETVIESPGLRKPGEMSERQKEQKAAEKAEWLADWKDPGMGEGFVFEDGTEWTVVGKRGLMGPAGAAKWILVNDDTNMQTTFSVGEIQEKVKYRITKRKIVPTREGIKTAPVEYPPTTTGPKADKPVVQDLSPTEPADKPEPADVDMPSFPGAGIAYSLIDLSQTVRNSSARRFLVDVSEVIGRESGENEDYEEIARLIPIWLDEVHEMGIDAGKAVADEFESSLAALHSVIKLAIAQKNRKAAEEVAPSVAKPATVEPDAKPLDMTEAEIDAMIDEEIGGGQQDEEEKSYPGSGIATLTRSGLEGMAFDDDLPGATITNGVGRNRGIQYKRAKVKALADDGREHTYQVQVSSENVSKVEDLGLTRAQSNRDTIAKIESLSPGARAFVDNGPLPLTDNQKKIVGEIIDGPTRPVLSFKAVITNHKVRDAFQEAFPGVDSINAAVAAVRKAAKALDPAPTEPAGKPHIGKEPLTLQNRWDSAKLAQRISWLNRAMLWPAEEASAEMKWAQLNETTRLNVQPMIEYDYPSLKAPKPLAPTNLGSKKTPQVPNRPRKPEPEPAGPEPKPEPEPDSAGAKARQEAADAIDDLKDYLDGKSFANPMGDPELARLAIRALMKIVDAGIKTFADAVKQLAKVLGKATTRRLEPVLARSWRKIAEKRPNAGLDEPGRVDLILREEAADAGRTKQPKPAGTPGTLPAGPEKPELAGKVPSVPDRLPAGGVQSDAGGGGTAEGGLEPGGSSGAGVHGDDVEPERAGGRGGGTGGTGIRDSGGGRSGTGGSGTGAGGLGTRGGGAGDAGGLSEARGPDGRPGPDDSGVEGGGPETAEAGGTGEAVEPEPADESTLTGLAKYQRDAMIGPEHVVFLRGAPTRIKANLQAIRTYHKLQEENRPATPEEKDQFLKWSSWGPNKEVFGAHKDFAGFKRELRDLLGDKGLIAARESTKNAIFTPPSIVRAIYDQLERMGFAGGFVLEPSMGNGHFFGAMPARILENVLHRTGIEKEPMTARMAQELYPNSDIRMGGFEDQKLSPNYDLVISNVPFGSYGVYDRRGSMPRFMTQKIHDYFFARALEVVRPGGLLAFITSKGTLDKAETRARAYLSDQADFLGAVRMNDKSLDGTAVIADIIFMQKRPVGAARAGEDWVETGTMEVRDPDKDAPKPIVTRRVNEYFIKHPEMVLGEIVSGNMYGAASKLGDTTVVESAEMLTIEQAMGLMPEDLRHDPAPPPDRPMDLSPEAYAEASKKVPSGSHYWKEGKLYRNDEGREIDVREELRRAVKADVPIKDRSSAQELERLGEMVALRDIVLEAHRAMLLGDLETARDAQARLGDGYDRLVKKWDTFIHGPRVVLKRALARDVYTAHLMYALEQYDAGTKTAKKSPIFTEAVLEPFKAAEKAADVADAMLISINERGRMDLEHMGKLLGRPAENVRSQLLRKGLAFEDPGAGGNMEPADTYLSGDVRLKLELAESANQMERGRFDRNIKALEKVVPEDLTARDVNVRLGSHWVPAELFQRFTAFLTGTEGKQDGGFRWFFIEHTGTWDIRDPGRYSSNTEANDWDTSDMDLITLVQKAAAMNEPVVKVEVPDPNDPKKTRMVRDEGKTETARQAVKKLQKEFGRWIWETDQEVTDGLLKAYNRKYNSIVPWKGKDSGAHLTFPGMNPVYSKLFRPDQKDAVYQVVRLGNTLLDRAVGSGKTWIGVTIAMETKRLGLARKTLIVVDNQTYEQFSTTARDMYPMGKILPFRLADTKGGKRQRKMGEIALNDWDMVIMPRSSYTKIPLSADHGAAFFERKLRELREHLAEMGANSSPRNRIQRIETQIARFEVRIKDLRDQAQADPSTLPFDELGFDQIILDESQAYKNLMYVSGVDRVKGLGKPDGSGRSLDTEAKTLWMESVGAQGRGLVFMSGTPIANSLVELYTLMKYLARPRMEQMGIINLDPWLRMFGQVTQSWEPTAAGTYMIQTRLRALDNMSELKRIYFEFTHVYTPEDLRRDMVLPDVGSNSAGKADYETFVTPMNDQMREIAGRARSLDEFIRKNFYAAKKAGITYFHVMNILKKGSLDHRLVGKEFVDYPDSKINKLTAQIHEQYAKTAIDSGHADVSNVIDRIVEETGVSRDKAKESVGDGLTQIVFIGQGLNPTDWDFVFYDILRQQLIERGVKPEHIEFIHDKKWKKTLDVLFERVNAGKVRILMGTLEKAGVGVNVQRLGHSMHVADANWSPHLIVQGEGRFLRNGNMNRHVYKYRYAAKGSGDEMIYANVYQKQKAIDEFRRAGLGQRVLQAQSSEVFSLAEMQQLSSNNPYVLPSLQAAQEVVRLEGLVEDHDRKQREFKSKLKNKEHGLVRYKQDIAGYERIIERRDPDVTMKVGGERFQKVGKFGEALRKAIVSVEVSHEDGYETVGEIGGFPIVAAMHEFERLVEIEGKLRRFPDKEWDVRIEGVDRLNPVSGATDAIALGRIVKSRVYSDPEKTIERLKEALVAGATEIEKLTSRIGGKSEHIEELHKAIKEAAALEAQRNSFDDTEQGEAEPVADEIKTVEDAIRVAAPEPTYRSPRVHTRYPSPGAPGTELTADQLGWIRKAGKKHPGEIFFGMGGAAANMPDDVRTRWQKFYDAIADRMKNPKSVKGKRYMRKLGRSIYGMEWGLSEDDFRVFEQLPGAAKLASTQAERINKEINQRIEDAEKLAAGGADRVLHKLAARFDEEITDVDLDEDPGLRRIYEQTMEIVNGITDEFIADERLHEYASAFGLRNFAEVVEMRRAENRGWLRRVFVREPDQDKINASLAKAKAIRPRLTQGMFKIRRSDKGTKLELWTLQHHNGDNKQFADEDAAIDALYAEQKKVIEEYAVGKLDYTKWRMGLIPDAAMPAGVVRELKKVQLLDPFGVRDIQNHRPIADVRVRIARTLVDHAVSMQVLKTYQTIADTMGVSDAEATADSPEGPPDYVRIPEHPMFAQLAGMWLPEPAAYNILKLREFKSNAPGLWFSAFNYLWKGAKTVLSPGTHGNNLFGLHLHWILDGISPYTHLRWYKAAYVGMRDLDADTQRLLKENELNAGYSRELLDRFWEVVEEMGKGGQKRAKYVRWMKMARKGGAKAAWLYDLPDMLSKLASYKAHRYQYGMSHKEALHKLLVYPNYSRPGEYAQWTRGTTTGQLVGDAFATYKVQVLKNMLIGVRDTPARLLMMAMMPGLITMTSMMILGLSDEHKELEEKNARTGQRKFGPFGWLDRYFQPVMPWLSADGKIERLDLRYKIPLASDVNINTGAGGIGVPFFLATPWADLAMEMSTRRDTYTGRDIWTDDDTSSEALWKGIKHIALSVAPAPSLVTRGFSRMAEAAMDPVNPRGAFTRTMLAEVFGIRFKEAYIRRADAFKLAKEKLNAKEYDAFREIMRLYNDTCKPEKAKRITPKGISASRRHDRKVARLKELAERAR